MLSLAYDINDEASSSPNQLSVISASGPVFAKTHTARPADGILSESGAGQARGLRHRTLSPTDIRSLSKVLRELESDPTACVIRADLRPGADADDCYRAWKPDHGSFRPHPLGRTWLCVDIDHMATPADFDHTSEISLVKAVRYALSSLPRWMSRATCHYQFSGSMGVPSEGSSGWEKAKLHLWFWLDRPVADQSLAKWAKSFNKDGGQIDPATFYTVQPNYTAAPVFVGMDDPLAGRRSGLVVGDVEVAEPPPEILDGPGHQSEIEAAARQHEERVEAYRARFSALGGAADANPELTRRERSYVNRAVRRAKNAIAAAGEGKRHATIRSEMSNVYRFVAGGVLDESVLDEMVELAKTVLPSGRQGEADEIRAWLPTGNIDSVSVWDLRVKLLGDMQPAAAPDTDQYSREHNASGATGLWGRGDGELCPASRGLVDAPCPNHLIPPGYWMNRDGIGTWKIVEKDGDLQIECKQFFGAPVQITKFSRDVATGDCFVRIAWLRHDGWTETTVPTKTIRDGRSLTEGLGHTSFPAWEDNRAQIVRFLNRYLAANEVALPDSHISAQLGWVRNGFLLGEEFLGDGERVELSPVASGARWVQGIRDEGSIEGWAEALRPFAQCPRVAIALMCSAVSPMLHKMGPSAPGFALSLTGRTSSGKTTIMSMGASIWGNPDKHAPDAYIKGFDMTARFMEQFCALHGNLPVMVDDTHASAQSKRLAPDLLYGIANGSGRGRANRSGMGMQATRNWKLTGILTGESSVVSEDQRGGARTRLIEVSGDMFEGLDVASVGEIGAAIARMEMGIAKNFGCVGRAIVEWLRDPSNAEWVSEEFERRRFELRAEAASAPEGRIMAYRAAMSVARDVLVRLTGLELVDPFPSLWEQSTGQIDDAAGGGRGSDMVWSWVNNNISAFRDLDVSDQQEPHGGWRGYIWRDRDAKWIGFDETSLRRMLSESGFELQTLVDHWESRGHLKTGAGNRKKGRRHVGGGARLSLYIVSFSAFDTEEDTSPL